jgi:cytoskeleton protein RodZ
VLHVKAAEDSWVEVRQADGSPLHNGLVKGGATIELKGNPPYRVVVGNASHVSVSFEGKPQDLTPHIRANNIARLQLR